MSRAYSLKYPAEIKENMYFAIETFAGHPGLQQTCRLEENVLVSGKGPVVFTHDGAHGRGDEDDKMASSTGCSHRLRFSEPGPGARGAVEGWRGPAPRGRAHAGGDSSRWRKDADAVLTTYAKITAEMIRADDAVPDHLAFRHRRGQRGYSPRPQPRESWSPSVPDYCIDEVSDHAMALLLSHRAQDSVFERARAGRALGDAGCRADSSASRHSAGAGRLSDRIPQLVAPKAKAFGMRVVAYDPYVPQDVLEQAGVERVEFAELVKISDYISIHTPLMPETHHLFNADVFTQDEAGRLSGQHVARPGGGRGGAWRRRWTSKEIGWRGARRDGKGADRQARRLFGRDNVILTPHTSFYSEESLVDLQTKAAEEVVRVLSGEAAAQSGKSRSAEGRCQQLNFYI